MTLDKPIPADQWRTSDFEELVQHVCTRPGMWVSRTSFASVCNFLNGFDMGRGGGPLLGFREWMVLRYNEGDNLLWIGLADCLVPADQDETRRIAGLGKLIGEYLGYRSEQGITKVFYDYGQWLLRRRWYRGPLRKKKSNPS